MNGPRRPDVGVIALVPEPWGGPWMPREHVLTRLGRHFHVVWMDLPLEWREWWLPGHARPARPPLAADTYPGFELYRPGPFLPEVYRPGAVGRWLEGRRYRAARRRLTALGARRIVVYLWRPEYGPALDRIPHDVSVYHIDDEYNFSAAELPLDPAEAALIRRVDQVIIHSPALLEKKGTLNPHTAFVPNGVDFRAFATPAAEPEDLARVPHPRVGYVGVIKEQLDVPMILSLARARPDWSFVMVGPSRLGGADQECFEALRGLPNGFALGGKPVAALPAYIQHVDVGLLPYRLNGYTKFIFPLKLHEYLAAGIPAVGTSIRSLQDFRSVVRLVEGPGDWVPALAAALEPAERGPEQVAARREVAKGYDWGVLVDRIAGHILDRLQ